MPAYKKDASTRARANRASTAGTLTAPAAGPVPDLPPIREWSDLTLAWWADIWASPMSSEYHESDKHQVIVLAVLMDDFFTAETRGQRTVISAEIRQHRTAFGMTPYDRRRLEWTIEQAEGAKANGVQRANRGGNVQPKQGNDPRSVLSIVS